MKSPGIGRGLGIFRGMVDEVGGWRGREEMNLMCKCYISIQRGPFFE